jgi:hypothetical protein
VQFTTHTPRSSSQTWEGGQTPGHLPPQPLLPHSRPAQLGVQHVSTTQTSPAPQQADPHVVPAQEQRPAPVQVKPGPHPGGQEPPQPSGPQTRPAQFGTHWQRPARHSSPSAHG